MVTGAECDHITPMLLLLHETVESVFSGSGRPAFCRSGLVHGEAAWDDCCDCGIDRDGQLWVRLVNMAPDPAFALPEDGKCLMPFQAIVAVGALRCVPTLDENGYPPTAAAEQESTIGINRDAALVRYAVDCVWAELPETYDISYRWEGWQPVGSEGGCGGGEHMFALVVDACVCQ
jgi:hypothetical protein